MRERKFSYIVIGIRINRVCVVSNPLSFTKELWLRGLPLDDAAFGIAPLELLNQFEKPCPNIDKTSPMEIPEGSGWLVRTLVVTNALAKVLDPIFEHYRGRWAVRDEIREDLLVRIESGEYMAVGYSQPRKHGDFPVEIPIDIWEGEIDWEKSTVKGNGLDYMAVRIIPRNSLTKITEKIALLQIAPPSAIPRKINPPRIGRPSCRKIVEIAYEKLKQSGEIDFLAPQIFAIRQIRDAVTAMFPDDIKGDRGLGDEAVRKVICEDFRSEREALKATPKL